MVPDARRRKRPTVMLAWLQGFPRADAWFDLQVDTAFQGTDREAVEMAAHLLRCDGLFLGSSAAMNCVGAVKVRPPHLPHDVSWPASGLDGCYNTPMCIVSAPDVAGPATQHSSSKQGFASRAEELRAWNVSAWRSCWAGQQWKAVLWLTLQSLCQVARALGPGHTIVTVLCDGGHRHLSRFHSADFLDSVGLTPQYCMNDLGFVA